MRSNLMLHSNRITNCHKSSRDYAKTLQHLSFLAICKTQGIYLLMLLKVQNTYYNSSDTQKYWEKPSINK